MAEFRTCWPRHASTRSVTRPLVRHGKTRVCDGVSSVVATPFPLPDLCNRNGWKIQVFALQWACSSYMSLCDNAPSPTDSAFIFCHSVVIQAYIVKIKHQGRAMPLQAFIQHLTVSRSASPPTYLVRICRFTHPIDHASSMVTFLYSNIAAPSKVDRWRKKKKTSSCANKKRKAGEVTRPLRAAPGARPPDRRLAV